MTTIVEIPLIPSTAQTLKVTLLQNVYTLQLKWNTVASCWVLDIYDANGVLPYLRGIPLVTGADLLGQYAYVGIGGMLVVLTIAVAQQTDEVPQFDELGTDGHLYFVVP